MQEAYPWIHSNLTKPYCDFCADLDDLPVAALICKPQWAQQRGLAYEADWYACQTCLDLVMKHDVEQLVDRGLSLFIRRNPHLKIKPDWNLRHELWIRFKCVLDALGSWPALYGSRSDCNYASNLCSTK